MSELEKSLKEDYEGRLEHGFLGYSHIYYNNYKSNREFDPDLHSALEQMWERIGNPPLDSISLELKQDLLISLCFHNWKSDQENGDGVQYNRALSLSN